MKVHFSVQEDCIALLSLDTRDGLPTDEEWENVEALFRGAYRQLKRFIWVIDIRNFDLLVLAERLPSVFCTVHPLRAKSVWQCLGTVILSDPRTAAVLGNFLEHIPARSPLFMEHDLAAVQTHITRMLTTHRYLQPWQGPTPKCVQRAWRTWQDCSVMQRFGLLLSVLILIVDPPLCFNDVLPPNL